jgi:hypothetical protein
MVVVVVVDDVGMVVVVVVVGGLGMVVVVVVGEPGDGRPRGGRRRPGMVVVVVVVGGPWDGRRGRRR